MSNHFSMHWPGIPGVLSSFAGLPICSSLYLLMVPCMRFVHVATMYGSPFLSLHSSYQIPKCVLSFPWLVCLDFIFISCLNPLISFLWPPKMLSSRWSTAITTACDFLFCSKDKHGSARDSTILKAFIKCLQNILKNLVAALMFPYMLFNNWMQHVLYSSWVISSSLNICLIQSIKTNSYRLQRILLQCQFFYPKFF